MAVVVVDVDVDVVVVDVDVDVLDVDRWLGSSTSQDFPSWSRCTRRWARCCPPRDACVGNNIGGNSGFLAILIMQYSRGSKSFYIFYFRRQPVSNTDNIGCNTGDNG